MLQKHLIVKTRPLANENNIVLWRDYRVTVLADGLFRVEQNAAKKFRDGATQSVWYRDMPPQTFEVAESFDRLTVKTSRCKLILRPLRKDAAVELDGKRVRLDNAHNLGGTYRTLDACNGDDFSAPWLPNEADHKISLGTGVCSKAGVAYFDDAPSLTLGEDGEVKPERGEGTDEYVFAYGDDYRAAVCALYSVTGMPPIVPRFALGNWWSRYHVYTDKEYLRLLNSFEERAIPLTVATIDMDWHYSTQMEADLHIKERGRDTEFYGGSNGWTGYSWNKRLFPDYKSFLKKIEEKDLKITLNLHPAAGVRWWEDQYGEMANALGRDASTGERIPFDITDADFINAYFSVLHKPYEKDGVAFWWIDWQQGSASGMEGLDPLWALNHYHYQDNALERSAPLILSRYSGIGSHRYPIGFSGDTYITWKTLAYLPYFTATATNVGYTWWSHDIGGHTCGENDWELYARFVQYGVFSPINRLHCTNRETMTKEPWAYDDGKGLIAEKYLRLRHALIPYLYTAAYRTNREGRALVEPLYYAWKTPEAYAYKSEYLFGSELLVVPVTTKAKADGYARVDAWLPEGKWTDVFTGDEYDVGAGGKKLTLLRTTDDYPVLAKSGAILPLSKDEGNSCRNPRMLGIFVFKGDGEYTLYEDGNEEGRTGELHTRFTATYEKTEGAGLQTLTICGFGDFALVPVDRKLKIRFKNIEDGEISVFVNGEKRETEELLLDCAAVDLDFKAGEEYRIEVRFREKTDREKRRERAKRVLQRAEGDNGEKTLLLWAIEKTETLEEYLLATDDGKVKPCVKQRLKETL